MDKLRQKDIHQFIVEIVGLLQKKVDAEVGMDYLPQEDKEYTKGQLYEASYILETVEKIIYRD